MKQILIYVNILLELDEWYRFILIKKINNY